MAIRGPKPLPASVMELFKPGAPVGEANLALGPNGGVPEAADGELVPSQRLQRDPDALDYFEMFRRTTGFGHLRPVDGPLLEMLCVNLSLFDRVVEEFAYSGESLTQVAMSGVKSMHPHFLMMTRIGETIRKLMIELALTPIERSRLRGGKGDNPADAAANKKREELRRKYLGAAEGGGSGE